MIESKVRFLLWMKKVVLSDQMKLQTKLQTSVTTRDVETLINLQALENEQTSMIFNVKILFHRNIEYKRE